MATKTRRRSRAIDEPYPVLSDDGSVVEEGPSFLDVQEGLIYNSIHKNHDDLWKRELLFLIDAWRAWGTSRPDSNDRVYKIIEKCLNEAAEAAERRYRREVKDYLVRLGCIEEDDELPPPFIIR